MKTRDVGPDVQAEVMLREPAAEAAGRVAEFLRRGGVDVSAVGAASISIRCDRTTFERMFQTRLGETGDVKPPGAGVRDFGPAGAAPPEPGSDIVVPDEIRLDVEGIYLQESARFFMKPKPGTRRGSDGHKRSRR